MSGGVSNRASGEGSPVNGGIDNIAVGEQASVSGGGGNRVLATQSSISGGTQNRTLAESSSISEDIGTGKPNRRWRNYVQSVDINVETYWTPDTLEELVNIFRCAEEESRHVHPVGAGYSFEDLAATRDWMVDLSNLSKTKNELIDWGGPTVVTSRALTDEWRNAAGHIDILSSPEIGLQQND